jgi:glucokinase
MGASVTGSTGEIAENGRFSVGVDLGGTNLRVASYAGGTDVLDMIHLPTRLSEGPERVVRDMAEAIRALSGKSYGDRRFAGAGIGTPGPLELPGGILRNPPNLAGWNNFNLREALESMLGFAVILEGDANVAALAESKLGAGVAHGVHSLCVLTLGTGVGSGFILEDRIWHGTTGMGGEAGHVIVQPYGGAPCGCGGSGCLEQYASATAVVRMGRERMGEAAPATSRELARMALGGDANAASVFETVGESLSIGLTMLVNTLNLPLYLLGGGVCEAWDLFAPTMFRSLHDRSYIYRLTEPEDRAPKALEWGKTYILPAQLGSTAGLLGACLLPLQHHADRPSDAESRLDAK